MCPSIFPLPWKDKRTHGTFLQQWEHKAKPVSFSYFNSGQSMKTEHEMCQFFLLQQWAVDENRTQNVSAFLTSTVGSPRKQNTKCQFFLLQQWAVHENRTQNVSVLLTSTVGSPRNTVWNSCTQDLIKWVEAYRRLQDESRAGSTTRVVCRQCLTIR